MIADLYPSTRTNLVLPLPRHRFSICARDDQSRVQASLIVRVADNAAEADIGANGTVIGALRPRIPIVRPTERPTGKLTVVVNQGVFLLDAVLGYFFEFFIPDGHSKVTEIRVRGYHFRVSCIFPHESFTEDQNVVTASEGIPVKGNRLQNNL